MSVALLPLLWAIGVLPSMLDLLLWSSEQANFENQKGGQAEGSSLSLFFFSLGGMTNH